MNFKYTSRCEEDTLELAENIESEKFNKLVDYFRSKVCGLFGNKNQEIYKEIVDDLYIITNSYKKIDKPLFFNYINIDSYRDVNIFCSRLY